MSMHAPLNWIDLSRSALKQNISALATLAGKAMLAVSVKANAYGHGLEPFVSMLKEHKRVAYLSVHSIEEAVVARQAGWDRRILLLGPAATNELVAITEFDIEPTVFTTETLRALGRLSNKTKRPLRTHLKLETGTYRQGISEREIPVFASIYKKYPCLRRPYAASMHFANIEDTTSHEYAEEQLKKFSSMVRMLSREGVKPTIRHTACSAAMILFDKTRFEMVRPGISVYGYWSSKETYLSYRLSGKNNDIFTPVLSWKTRITQLKKVPADSFVGYGCTYRTTAPARIAIVPIGYYDGYPRAMSNRGYVLVNGRRAPVRGRVCMNLLMVDVTDIKNVRLGAEVTLIGSDGDERITAGDLADWGQTIHYEILARLQASTPRLIAP